MRIFYPVRAIFRVLAQISKGKAQDTGMLTELQGQIERITFTNEENGYTIARLKVYGRQDLVTMETSGGS